MKRQIEKRPKKKQRKVLTNHAAFITDVEKRSVDWIKSSVTAGVHGQPEYRQLQTPSQEGREVQKLYLHQNPAALGLTLLTLQLYSGSTQDGVPQNFKRSWLDGKRESGRLEN